MKTELSISIVTYKNAQNLLRNLLSTLSNSSLKTEIFVVDNSPSRIIEKLCQDRGANYIFNDKNLGFGAAHNVAIRKMIGVSKYHLIVNPDISVEPGVIEEIYRFMEENADVGAVMPQILSGNDSIQRLCKLLPTPFDLIWRRLSFRKALLERLAEKRNEIYELRFTGYNKIMNVPCLSGSFMVIRTDAIEKVGAFDETFFMYLEDFDLCRRIHRHYKTLFYPKVSVRHKHKRASYKNSSILMHHVSSAIKYFNKWGWFFDKERRSINKAMLKELKGREEAGLLEDCSCKSTNRKLY